MPANPATLQQSFIKLKRAQRHIAELDDLFEAYLRETPPQSSLRVLPTIAGAFASIEVSISNEAVPEEAAAIFGDAIHNLRAALDLAACECVRSHQDCNDKNVYFPFCEKEDDFESFLEKRNITKASPEVVDYIRSLKPFRGGNIALRAIHDLDLRDKHRGLMPQVLNVGSPIIELYDDNGVYYETPIIVGDPDKATSVAFVFPNDTAFAGEEIIPTLHKLMALTDGIITALASILNSGAAA